MDRIDRALELTALGRLALGVPAWVAPDLSARLGGLGPPTPQTRYLMRIFGARAAALGLMYLLSDGDSRRRAQRISLMVDTADTLMGPFNGLPRQTTVASVTLTGLYAAVGWARVLRDKPVRRS